MAAEDVKEPEELKMEVIIPSLKQSVDSPPVEYKFLSELNGVWGNTGNVKSGLNVIFVPPVNSVPTGPPGLNVISFPYYETLTFTLNNLARNRGGVSQQYNGVVEYSQIVKGSQDGKSPDTVQHIENGMYLYLDNVLLEDPTSDKDKYVPQYNYCRSGTVPHGNSLMLFGNELDVIPGPPKFDDLIIEKPFAHSYLSTEPFPIPPQGYGDAGPGGPKIGSPNAVLTAGITGKTIKETRTLKLTSENPGNITNTPFITEFANTTKMDVFLWLETVEKEDGSGGTYKQLQYLQRMILKFGKDEQADEIVSWPHITCNTLTLQNQHQ